VKDTPKQKPSQPGPVENARPLPYAQIPLELLTLPTGERAAAIEVWAALHHHLRLGSRPERITDEELAGVPWLIERSAEHGRKGLEILERLGLITRHAKGSSRRVAITATLRGSRHVNISVDVVKLPKSPTIRNPRIVDPLPEGWATDFWDRVRAGKVVPTD
jgi:hypothetical protein